MTEEQEELAEETQMVDKEAVAEQTEADTLSIGELELQTLREESQSYKDKYLRLLAESDNARKRLQKDRKQMVQGALETLILDFLHPIDHMENALKHTDNMSDEVKNWAHGFNMILTQFQDVLTNHGIKKLESLGKTFDPHLHEAVEMVETEKHPEGTVVEENVRGYTMGERTLRPARVKVAKTKVKETIQNEENDHV